MSRAGSKPLNGGVLGLYPSHVSKQETSMAAWIQHGLPEFDMGALSG
jgi:hypothetical protein